MRLAILSCGAVVVKEQDHDEWLFGAPDGVDINLKEAGIDAPKFVFLTALRSPGYTKLGHVVGFKEKPLSMNGLTATPIKHKHGTDYTIESEGAKVLFSERGDVAAKDLENYDLCIIKNKHRGDDWQDHIITWPWSDAEYLIADNQAIPISTTLKVYSKMSEAPDNLKKMDDVALTLSQVNWIASQAEGIPEDDVKNPWAVAKANFKRNFHKEDGKWVKNKSGQREKDITYKVWSDIEDVPSNIRVIDGAELTLEQANAIARMAEAAGEEDKENFALAVEQFKNEYKKDGDNWVKKEETKPESKEKQAKVSKADANYRPSEGDQKCGNCTYYSAGACSKVQGDIDPEYVSDIYAPAEKVVGNEVSRSAIKEQLMKIQDEARAAFDDQYGSKRQVVPNSRMWLMDIDPALGLAYVEAGVNELYSVPYIYDGTEYNFAARNTWTPIEREYVPKGVIKRLKEMTEEGPVQRLGDMLVADLHTAYNDFADAWYKQGYMDETERKQVGKSIGAALDALRGSMPKELQQRVLGGPATVPAAFKELAPDVPDEIDGIWSTVYKSEDGKWHWATITSSSIWDGHDEYVLPEAMDYAVSVAKVIGPGPLRFKHAPGLDGGECTHQSTAGGFLFEKGDFYDNTVGQAMRKLLQKDPTWRISPGLLYAPKDLINGVYKRVVVFERSMTQEPANQTTAILATDGGLEMAVKQLSTDELAQVAKDLELDVEYVTKLHRQALNNGSGVVGLKEFQEFVEKESKSSKGDYDEEDEEEMTEDEKKAKAKELLAGLEPEQREMLKELMDETEAPEVKLQAEVTQLKEALAEQGQRMDQLITLVAGNLSGKEKEQDHDALAEFFSSLPRSQAQFVSKTLGREPDETDEEIMTLLKEIKAEMSGQAGSPFGQGGHIYDSFTSKRLNPSQRES